MKTIPYLLTFAIFVLSGLISHLKADDRIVMTIDDKEITVDEFLYLYRKNRMTSGEEIAPREYASMYALFKMKVFEAEAAGIDTTIGFRTELEAYKASIANDGMLAKEYREGMLLFEISNKTVWQRAATDYEGLEALFEAKKSNYLWEGKRAKGWLLYSDSEDTIAEACRYLSESEIIPEDIRPVLKARFGNGIAANKFIVGQGVNAIVDALVFNCGNDYTTGSPWKSVGVYGCRIIENPETWQDVRGAVISDYQQKLTDEWENHLMIEHKVVYNYDVIDEMEDV